MRIWNNKIISNELKLKNKGILSTKEYVDNLIEKNQIKLKNTNIINNVNESQINCPEVLVNKNQSFLSSVINAFSLKNHLLKKNSAGFTLFDNDIKSSLKEFNPILGVNINDPIIDEFYITKCLDNRQVLLDQISPEYLGTEHEIMILNDYKLHLIKMYDALNSEKVDVEFIKKSFLKMYSIEDKYNGQLRGQKIRHDILMFQQAFNKNPAKFASLEDLIPVNLGTIVDVKGCSEPNIICHSIGGNITADALKHAHEILISRAISAKFNIKIFVKLDQNDAEVSSVLDFFNKIGNLSSGQINTDIAFLDEENMTFSEWDIKNEYLKIVVPRKFAQQVIQLGNYYNFSSQEKFTDNYVFELLRDFEKKIKSPQTTIEQRAVLIKRHTELVSFLFSKDPILLVPSGNKNFFSSIKMFIDLSSYFKP